MIYFKATISLAVKSWILSGRDPLPQRDLGMRTSLQCRSGDRPREVPFLHRKDTREAGGQIFIGTEPRASQFIVKNCLKSNNVCYIDNLLLTMVCNQIMSVILTISY